MLAAGVLVALLVVGVITSQLFKSPAPRQLKPSPAPAPGGKLPQLPASDRSLMGLTAGSGRAAPNFSLTDQSGHRVNLGDLRGRPLVLTFLDTACRDVCPVETQEMADAARILGARAADVTFAAVNVDAARASVAAASAFTAAHGLTALPHWYFLTGPPATLRAVWTAYGVTVEVDPQTGALAHTAVMDFIGPNGALRYQATPFANEQANGTGSLPAATISQWAQGIAHFALASASGTTAG